MIPAIFRKTNFKLFNNNNLSVYPRINIQSLTNRGTNLGDGVSMGVKVAKELSPNWSLAFGGENIFHFDENIDLGHNFYIMASTYIPLSNSEKSNILFHSALSPLINIGLITPAEILEKVKKVENKTRNYSKRTVEYTNLIAH